MLFEAAITIPANTASTDPTTQEFAIAHGIITKIMVRPRPGHAGLAHLVIKHHEHQIAPSTPGMDFSGDAFPIDWEEYYESYYEPYTLKLVGWNDDDTFSHSFDVFVAISPKKSLVANQVSSAISDVMSLVSSKTIYVAEE